MPKGPRGEKRPADVIDNAVKVMRIATAGAASTRLLGYGASMSTDEIAGRIIETKSFDAADAALRKAIGDQVLMLLRSFRKRGTVEQIGLGRGVRWKLVSVYKDNIA
jgi:hypothetical protein